MSVEGGEDVRRFYDDEIATLFGLNEAILLNDFAYWIRKNRENGAAFHDGRYWTYSTANELCKRFPFWSERTIRRAIGRLVAGGYIDKGHFSPGGSDRTTWYTITEKAEELLKKTIQSPCDYSYGQNDHMHSVKMTKSTGQNDQMETVKMTKSTNNKKREEKRENKKNTRAKLAPPFENPSPEILESWEGFVEMRKARRNALTERAAKLIANKLERLAPGNDAMKAAILDQSVERGWQGVFPLKNDTQRRTTRSGGQQSAEEMYEEAMDIMKKGGLL